MSHHTPRPIHTNTGASIGRRALVAVSVLALVLGVAFPAGAKPPPDKPGGGKDDPGPPPAGLVYSASEGALWEITTDGSSGTALPCPGVADLSHDVIGGERYFIWTEYLPDLHPSGWEAAELFAISHSDASVEPCAPIQLTDFYNESETSVVVPVIPRWSPDGSMVAFLAFDSAKRDACPPEAPSGECPEPYDVWLADFDTTSGPALSNLRVLAPEFGASHPPSWSRDGAYLATSKARAGGSTGIFVIDTSNGAVFDVSPDPEVFSVYPAFSPVADRIAYIGPTPRGDAFRHEIYVGDFAIDSQTQTPAPLSSVVQVTDKKNMKSLEVRFPAWSPDGEHLAFSGEEGGWLNSIRRLYRIAADGSAKAVLLSAFDESAQFSMSLWRTSP